MQPNEITADKILELEFNYIKDTANQAVDDRYKLLNFYIAIATFVATIAIGAFTLSDVSQLINLKGALAVLCLLISFIGWIFIAMMIRLRQAWYESIQALNQIKRYYQEYAGDKHLAEAFLWNPNTMPAPHRFWNIHFYSALQVMIIDSSFLAAALVVLHADILVTIIVVILSVAVQILTYKVSLFRNL